MSSQKSEVVYFSTRREAEVFCQSERQSGRDRDVYEIAMSGFEVVFVVAHTINRAHDYAVYLLRDRIGLSVKKCTKEHKTLNEQIYELSAQQVNEMTRLLAERKKQLKGETDQPPVDQPQE